MNKLTVNTSTQADFSEVVGLIVAARQQAYQAVNTSLIDLYWQVGAYISNKIKAAEWGDGQSFSRDPAESARLHATQSFSYAPVL